MKGLLPSPGETVQDNMQWVIEFLKINIQASNLKALGLIAKDIMAIAKLGISRHSRPFPSWEIVPDTEKRPEGRRGEPYREYALREDLMGYQRVIRTALHQLIAKKRTTVHVSTASIAFEIDHTGKGTHPTMILLKPTIDDVMRGFDFRVLFVLQRCGQELEICQQATCKKVFVKNRKGKQFCSRTCGSLKRVREWRRKKQRSVRHGTKK